nr:PREDICTED: chymotrypsin-2-like [Linepithema humile]
MAWIVQLFNLLAIYAGSHKLDPSPYIVNGRDALLGDIPYQVSLQIDSHHFCGGAILNEKYVITAAHCVEEKNQSSGIKVIAGSTDLKDPKVTNLVEKVIVHERFNRFHTVNDIALLKVVNKFKTTSTLQFVPLPPRDFVVKANDIATVSGWGRLWQGGPATNQLQRVDIVITDQIYCSYKYMMIGYNISTTQICAYDWTTEKGVCQGDSGGPLTVGGNLVGLVSWGIGCASTSFPTVFTRVSSYLDWIKTNAV